VVGQWEMRAASVYAMAKAGVCGSGGACVRKGRGECRNRPSAYVVPTQAYANVRHRTRVMGRPTKPTPEEIVHNSRVIGVLSGETAKATNN